MTFGNDEDWPSLPAIKHQLLLMLNLYGRPVEPDVLYSPLADHFHLSRQQRHAKRNTRDEPLWNNRVQTARARLVEDGFSMATNTDFGPLPRRGARR
jgi:hypothetical protein